MMCERCGAVMVELAGWHRCDNCGAQITASD
jgi:rubredoxin